jgi:hypothetical protein
MENEKRLNIGIKTRTIIVWCELASRIIALLYSLIMLPITLFCIPFMMFSQKHYDCWIEMLRKQINDEW